LACAEPTENPPVLDLLGEHSRRISNDVGGVKTHVLRAGRRSRLSKAKESAEAAVARSPRLSMSTLSRSIRVIASRRCLHQTSLRSPADHDDSCELPPFEGGGSANQCFGDSGGHAASG